MYKRAGENRIVDKEERGMGAAANLERTCTISESIMQSCKEVKDMREGRTPKRSLNELFANIEKWSKEEKQ